MPHLHLEQQHPCWCCYREKVQHSCNSLPELPLFVPCLQMEMTPGGNCGLLSDLITKYVRTHTHSMWTGLSVQLPSPQTYPPAPCYKCIGVHIPPERLEAAMRPHLCSVDGRTIRRSTSRAEVSITVRSDCICTSYLLLLHLSQLRSISTTKAAGERILAFLASICQFTSTYMIHERPCTF